MVLRPHMRNSTGCPVFSDFQSDLSRVAVSRPLVKGNEDAGYEGGSTHCQIRHRTSFFCKVQEGPSSHFVNLAMGGMCA